MSILGSSNSGANKDIISKMGLQLSDWVENILGKGEIACFKHQQQTASENIGEKEKLKTL